MRFRFFFGQASPTNPIAPTSVPSGVRPTPTGSTINVHSGDDLQMKYDNASCGDDLVLDDGAVFQHSYVFNKQCSAPNWILVEGTGCKNGTSAIPTYVTAANINATNNPKLPAPDLTHFATLSATVATVPVIVTTDGSNVPAKYNYFGCLELTSTVFQFFTVGLTNSNLENAVSQLGDHIYFDRTYVHPSGGSITGKGFFINGSNVAVVNSYVSDIFFGEAQAILMSAGPGPVNISNNFLSAISEIVMSGGTGQTPGYHCTVASSPAPTNSAAPR